MTAVLARLLAAIDSAVDTFLNAVVDRLIAAWVEAGEWSADDEWTDCGCGVRGCVWGHGA